MHVVLFEPRVEIEVVVLLAPEHPGEGLAHDVRLVGAGLGRRDRPVELVGIGDARREHLVDRGAVEQGCGARAVVHADHGRSVRGDVQHVVGGRLRSRLVGVHRVEAAVHDVLVERVLHVGSGVRRSEQALVVRFVLGEEERRCAFAPELPRPERRVLGDDRARRTRAHRPLLLPVPPHVAEPQVGKDVDRRPLRAAVGQGDADRDVLGLVLRVLDVDVEVVVVVEDAGVRRARTRARCGSGCGSSRRCRRRDSRRAGSGTGT